MEVSGVVSLRYIFRVRGVCDRAEFLNEPPGAEAYQLFLTRACIYNSQRLPSLPPGVNFSFHKVHVSIMAAVPTTCGLQHERWHLEAM